MLCRCSLSCLSSAGTAGPWSCSRPPLHQGCPGLTAVGRVPGSSQGKDCCVETTCHLLGKMFWILSDESLTSPAAPSVARTDVPVGLYQGTCWKTLSRSSVLCKVHTPTSRPPVAVTGDHGAERPLHLHAVGRRHGHAARPSLEGPSRVRQQRPASARLGSPEVVPHVLANALSLGCQCRSPSVAQGRPPVAAG